MARKPGLPKLTQQNMEDAPEENWVQSIKSTVNVAVQEIDHIRSQARGIQLLKNADVEMVEFDVQMPDPWIDATLLNDWIIGPNRTGYCKQPDGTVEVRVSLDATNPPGDPIAFVLPDGYRPDSYLYGLLVNLTVATPHQEISFEIDVDGKFSVLDYVNVDGRLRFLAADSTPIPRECWPKYVGTKLKKVSGVLVANVMDAETSKPLPAGAVFHPV